MNDITPTTETAQTILLAEDDTSMRTFLEKMLTKRGYDVIACEDGQAAFDVLQKRPVDLLLTDIVMPNMDGVELTQKAQALYPDIKTLYITGFSASASSASTTQATDNKDNVISKPFHIGDLTEKILEILKEPS
jgi:two-component system cell cycle response regulator CpdR